MKDTPVVSESVVPTGPYLTTSLKRLQRYFSRSRVSVPTFRFLLGSNYPSCHTKFSIVCGHELRKKILRELQNTVSLNVHESPFVVSFTIDEPPTFFLILPVPITRVLSSRLKSILLNQ